MSSTNPVSSTSSETGLDVDEKSNVDSDQWNRIFDWIHCICVVTFDLELGQAMEEVYPPNVILTEEDKTNICYLAFPDSNSSCMGDTQFHIRIKQSSRASKLTQSHITYNNKCPVFLRINPHYYFGFVYFRQIKDQSIPRGYFQKSVIVISRLPFISLFTEVCSIIAPEYFDNGLKSIEAACHEINRWQAPMPGDSLKLPLFGHVIQSQIPRDFTVNNLSSSSISFSSYSVSTLYPSINDLNMFESLSSVISHIHILWELVLTGEPLVVLAPSPEYCSKLVQALVSMIFPLMYNADYRPYFTIHDSEFKDFMTKTRSPPSVILGVTNPFFGKTLQHWPHIIRLSENITTSKTVSVGKQKLRKSGSTTLFDAKTGVYTHYKPFLNKDKLVIRKLIKGLQMKRPSEVQSAILRRHLLELTQSFMIPLERYMSTLMPLKKNISPLKAAPHPLPFNPDDFIASLDISGPQLTSTIKGNWEGLYRKFFRSLNFSGWYHTRYQAMYKKLKALHLEALSHMNIQEWLQGKEEVEIVDMILKIKTKIDEIDGESLPLNEIIQIQLKNRLNDIILSLPDDLRNIINIS
ncbi:protein DENND6B-like [Planococcus citri]|uniref:protein DENND6B-like n=1 Tax=Planococcus citri TaxID=170843 RepID=UPI0031F894C0